MKKAFTLLFTLITLLGVLAAAIPIVASASDEVVDPFAGYSKWDGVSIDNSPFEGFDPKVDYTGTDKHIEIKTAAQLAALAKIVNEAKWTGGEGNNNSGAFQNLPIYVTANIDLCGYEFGSIGNQMAVANFAGLLEGRLNGEAGKAVTIANYVNLAYSAQNQGFIGTLRGGALKNFTFVNAAVGNTRTAGFTGIAIGCASKIVEISGITAINSTVIASKASTSYTCGGLIGMVKADREITYKDMAAINVTIETPLSGAPNVGGIIGALFTRYPVTFENFYSNVSLANAIETEYGYAAVDDIMVGGIVGVIHLDAATPDVTLKNCHSNATLYTVSADKGRGVECGIGSFVGSISTGKLALENCLSTSNNIDDAIVGCADADVEFTMTNVYAVEKTATWGGSFNASAVSYTRVELDDLIGAAAATTLAGFDFENVWEIKDEYLVTLKGVNDPQRLNFHEHKWGEGVETLPATHTTTGVMTYVCACGDIKEEVLATVPHEWDEGVVTLEPTHAATGEKLYTCDCGETKTEVMEMIAHEWGEGVVTLKPTHTSRGFRTFTCECGAVKVERVDPLGHEWDSGVITTEPTHNAKGVTTYTCDCGATRTEAIDTIPHEWDSGIVTIEPTHQADGEKTYTCGCGAIRTAMIARIPHEWNAGEITIAPTHMTTGVKTYTCVCGETKTETVAELPEHDSCIYTQYNAENHTQICACGDIEIAAHEWNEGNVILEPTVRREGTKATTCQKCGYVKYESVSMADMSDRSDNQSNNETGFFGWLFGCGSTISGSAGMMLLIVGAAVMTLRKKKEN